MEQSNLKYLTDEELIGLYKNSAKMRESIIDELIIRGLSSTIKTKRTVKLNTQQSIQMLLKLAGFDMLLSGGTPEFKRKSIKWRHNHERIAMEYIMDIGGNKYIQLCGEQLCPILSINDVCHFDYYHGDSVQPYKTTVAPFIKIVTSEPVFSNAIKNFKIN